MGLSFKSLGAHCALLLGAVSAPNCGLNQSGNLQATQHGDLSAGEPERAPFDAKLDAACGTGEPTDLGMSSLSRFPYLQNVTSSSADVLWTSSQDGSPGIQIKPAGDVAAGSGPQLDIPPIAAAIDQTAALPAGAQFMAQAGDLQAGDIDCYRVEESGEAWTDWTGFQTAPGPGEKVRLAVMGDLGEDTADQNALLDQLINTPMQAVLITGDIAYPSGTLSNFEDNFFSVYAPVLSKIPFFPASGNHDYADDGAVFRSVFDLPDNGTPADQGRERWYSFDWGDVHVAALDTEKIGAAQAAWLESDLAANDSRWTLVIMHKPAYSSGKHGDTDAVKKYFVPIFEKHDVDLVLAGHDHDYERFNPKNGVTYVVTGGGGVGTRPISAGPDSAFALSVIHMLYLEATSDKLTGWAIDATGKVFDTFEIH